MICKILNLVALFVTCCLLMRSTEGYVQELSLFESTSHTDSYFVFRRHVPDFTNDITQPLTSYCMRGFWIAYSDIDYEGFATLLGTKSTKDSLECYNETFSYRSFRHGAARETLEDALSIYPQERYEGIEVLVTGRAKSQLTGLSVMVTGSKDWLLFEGQNFEGRVVCLTNFDTDVAGHVNVTDTFGLPQIGSVVKGCETKMADVEIFRKMKKNHWPFEDAKGYAPLHLN